MNAAPVFHVTALFNGQASFHECILFCMGGLRELGYDVTYADNQLKPDAINIVLGSYTHLSDNATWRAMSAQAADIIIYNWEQVGSDVPWITPRYVRQMTHTHVWDYNVSNVAELRAAGVADVHHVPMAYTPEMSAVPTDVEQDIDVLFYGVINERRKKVLDDLRAKGLKVVSTDECPWMMGDERDQYIARAKVVLNMHRFEETKVFEIARVSYLLANRKAVVSEISSATVVDDDIRMAIASDSIDRLVDLCVALVQDEARRVALAQKGFDVFSQRKAGVVLKQAVDRYLQQRAAQPAQIGNLMTHSVALPTTLQIGAGEQWRYDYCNIDTREDFAADLILDLDHPLPFEQTLSSWRFGSVQLQRSYFQKIIAKNVFQRVKNVTTVLTHCLELLQDGGVLELSVPLDLSYDAWAHIDDKRAFNDKTWERIVESWWQYGWQTHRFELASIGFGLHNEFGMKLLAENGNDWGAALRTARAIDVIQVTLRKRELTDDERKQLPQALFMD